MAAGTMNSRAAAVVNKITMRDPALGAKIKQDLANGDADAFSRDTITAQDTKHYITVREWQYLTWGTKFGGKNPMPSGGGSAYNAAPKAAASAAGDALKSLNPLAGLFQANIWLRFAEVGIGVLLVAVGVAKLTNAVQVANKIAGVVSKVPIPV